MIKPIWVLAGLALLGTATAAGACVVASGGDDGAAVQRVGTATASTSLGRSSTPVSTTADTLTYSDPTYGYSFAYPSSWHLSAEGQAIGSVTLYSYDLATARRRGGIPDDKLKAVFWVAEGVDQPLERWLEEGDNSPGQIDPPTVLSQTDGVVGGKSALVRVTESGGLKYISYYVPLGAGRVFVVNGGSPDSQVWPLFDPVLDSIRFAS